MRFCHAMKITTTSESNPDTGNRNTTSIFVIAPTFGLELLIIKISIMTKNSIACDLIGALCHMNSRSHCCLAQTLTSARRTTSVSTSAATCREPISVPATAATSSAKTNDPAKVRNCDLGQ